MGNSDSKAAFSYEQQLFADKSTKQSIEVPDALGVQPDNATLPRRMAGLEAGLISVPFANEEGGGCKTVHECFQRGLRLSADKPCFGTRVWVTVDAPAAAAAPAATAADEKKEGDLAVVPAPAPASSSSSAKKYKIEEKTPVRGAYVWETYTEIANQARDFGSGLVSMGFAAGVNVGIFSSNRVEWMITALGLYAQSMRVVALYASLGEGAVEFIVNHAETPIVCVSKQNISSLLKSLDHMKGVKVIIQWDVNAKYNNVEEEVSEADIAKAKAAGIELVGFNTVIARGAEAKNPPVPPKPQDIAYIMYTSGTTGNPKGAILLHKNICATIAATPPIFDLNNTDVYLSYLPLAHIFETIAESSALAAGARIGFFQDNIRKLTNDMQDVKPTLFCGVPRVFTRIHQVVTNGVAEKSCLARFVFNHVFQKQVELVRQGRPVDPSYDAKIFAPLRKRMGLENVRVIVTGAAPMAPYLAEFLRVVSAKPVIEGYGLTETTAAISVATRGDPNLGHCGPPLCCTEVRLESVADMGYLHTDPMPRGEICVRGESIFAGYWKDEENTKATIIDGWLHTGDVGRFNPNGTLSIIDRKKNMFKLSQGEYVAVERVEQAYQRCGSVGQVWVYGNSFKSFLLGVVVPAAEPTAAWLHSKGWWPRQEKESTKLAADNFVADFKSTLEGPHKAEIKAWIVQQLKEQEKPLKGYEKVTDWIVESDINNLGMAFHEQNDLLTPTFKMRRPQLLQKYIQQLKAMYGQHKEPVGADEKWPGEP